MKETISIQTIRGAETWDRLVPDPRMVDKNLGGRAWEQGVSARHQGSSARKISSLNFRLQKPARIESVEEADGAISSYSWGTHTQTHLLRLTPSKFQHQGDSFKGTGGI